MRVLVIDGSEHITKRLQELLAETFCVTASFAATTAEAAERALRQLKPDAVLIDMALNDGASNYLLKNIRQYNPQMAVVAFCAHEAAGPDYPQADYVFDKYNDFEKLPETLNAIAEKKE